MKVYAKLMGGLTQWYIDTEDHVEAIQAVKDEIGTNPQLAPDGAVLVLLQGGKA